MNKGRFQKQPKGKRKVFYIVMLVYAVVALIAIGLGLNWFYGFIGAYEASRPKHVLEGYIQKLDGAHVAEHSGNVIGKIDHHIQSEQACREYIENALTAPFTYAKKSKESTDTKQVFAIRCGMQVVGEFTMETVQEDEYGFAHWEITDESFDVSYLIGDTVSTVAPDHYTVSVNGAVLDSSYVVGEPIGYDALEMFYDEYDLPAMVTYEAGPFLGSFEMTVTDTEGKPFDLEQAKDLNLIAQNCPEEMLEPLDEFVDIFIDKYVIYTGGSNKSADLNLYYLLQHVVKGSDFEERMRGAWYGQQYTQSWGDKIVEIRNNYFFQLEKGKYVCDVTYLLDTTGKQGVVRTTNNVRMVVVKTSGGLKVLTLYNY